MDIDSDIKEALQKQYKSEVISEKEYKERVAILYNTHLFEIVLGICQIHNELKGTIVRENVSHASLSRFETSKKEVGCIEVCRESIFVTMSLYLYGREDGLAYCFEIKNQQNIKWQEIGFLPSAATCELETLLVKTIGQGERVRMPHFRISEDPIYGEVKFIPYCHPQGKPPELSSLKKWGTVKSQHSRHVETHTGWIKIIVQNTPLFLMSFFCAFGLIQIFEWWFGHKSIITAHTVSEFGTVGPIALFLFIVLLSISVIRNISWLKAQTQYWQNRMRDKKPEWQPSKISPTLRVLQKICSILKGIERTFVNPWIFWPIVMNLALFGTNLVKISQKKDTVGLYFALFLAWYILIFFYFLNISFFDMFVSSQEIVSVSRRFEDVKYANYSHFTLSGIFSRTLFQITPQFIHTSIVYIFAILGGFLPLIGGILAPVSSRILGTRSKITQFLIVCASSPDFLFYGFLFLGLLVVVGYFILIGISSEPLCLISGGFVLGLGILIILYPQIFWQYNHAVRPPIVIYALLPPLGVIYVVLQTISFRITTDQALCSQKEYEVGLAWLALLVSYFMANIIFPLE